MTSVNRFCVQFSGTLPHCSRKTRLLYADSKPDDVRDIWRLVYDSEPPIDVVIIVGNHTCHSILDEHDFEVFMAMAEDQYRLLPSKPLDVVLSIPGEFRPSPLFSTPSPDRGPPATFQYEARMNSYCKPIKKDRESPFNPIKQDSGSQPSSPHYNGYNGDNKWAYGSDVINNFNDENRQSPQDLSMKPYEFAPKGNNFAPRSEPLSNGFAPPMTSSASNPPVTSSINNYQQQRVMQGSPSASYILQNFLRSNFERAAAMQLAAQRPCDVTNDSILSNALIDYRNMQDPTDKKRKRKSLPKNSRVGRVLDTTKRMRSSPTQSNIEYHYERAIEYHTMTEEEQKCHNSAHRSHWKHLLFVAEHSPSFLTTFRNAKYDEWSSEARDIFALCMPDKYKWSFLTLSKQGDVLCRRIMKRIGDLRAMQPDEKPDWCPTEETLSIAHTRAEERLAQLDRILIARTAASENNEKLHENEKQMMYGSILAAMKNNFQLPGLKPIAPSPLSIKNGDVGLNEKAINFVNIKQEGLTTE